MINSDEFNYGVSVVQEYMKAQSPEGRMQRKANELAPRLLAACQKFNVLKRHKHAFAAIL